jgi:hypothetical protein
MVTIAPFISSTPSEVPARPGFYIAPNISRGGVPFRLSVEKPAAQVVWSVFNTAGERIHPDLKGTPSLVWHPGNLASGLYLVRVEVFYDDGTKANSLFRVLLIR